MATARTTATSLRPPGRTVLIRMGVPQVMVGMLATAILWLFTSGGASYAESAARLNSPMNDYRGFTDPETVAIRGYSGSAMEPFISRDGRYLLFNTSNVQPTIPSLQFATRVDSNTFAYQGKIRGTNKRGALSGTPTLDLDGNLYFISTRSYSQTFSTVYTGRFDSGHVTGVHLVRGVSGGPPGVVDFDVDVSPDGSTLYVSVGDFGGQSHLTSAGLTIFDRKGSVFVPDPHSAQILDPVDKPGLLTYAASISADGLELFFTQEHPPSGEPAVYRAVRTERDRAFDHVQRVAAITGFAEAPSISADGTTLYYHQRVGTTFQIGVVTRP
jgi:WD40-like Beta Propeller Repeat